MFHASIGMASELGEVAQALDKVDRDPVNLLEECGDVLWYVTVAIDALRFDPEWYLYSSSHPTDILLLRGNSAKFVQQNHNNLVSAVSLFADLIKKSILYDKKIMKKDYENVINDIVVATECLLLAYNYTLADAMQRNSDKLAKRYAGGYSNEKAIQRDVAAERKALEGIVDDKTEVIR
jgi:hypothetical protein